MNRHWRYFISLDSRLGFGFLRRPTTYIHVGVRGNDEGDRTSAFLGMTEKTGYRLDRSCTSCARDLSASLHVTPV